MTGFNPRNSTRYTGTDVWLANIVTRNRRPTGADYRQPETGRNYVIFAGWQVAKDPTTGVEGELWLLSKIVANVAYWAQISGVGIGGVLTLSDTANTLVYPLLGNIKLSGTAGQIDVTAGANELVFSLPGGGGAVDSFAVPHGTSPVVPDINGLITITEGAGITVTGGLNTYDIALTGGTGIALQGVTVDATSGAGTNPTVPSGAGLVILTGAQVATGTIGANVIRSTAKAVNSITLDIQQTTTAAAKDTTKNGVSHFKSTQFTNDQGFISITNPGPTPVVFQAEISAALPNVTGDGTFYAVIFDDIVSNVGAGYNNVTGIFTAPISGYYMICVTLLASQLNNALFVETNLHITTTTRIYATGSINPFATYVPNATNSLSLNGSAIVYLAATDTCRIGYIVGVGPKTAGLATSGSAIDPRTFFSGFLLYQA